MKKVTIIGIDLAKNVFQLHGAATDGSVVFRKKLSRQQFRKFMAAQPACIVAMEACGSSHYWAREMARLGHEPRLLAPHYVKPFIKRQKNDAADAEAIVEAAHRRSLRRLTDCLRIRRIILLPFDEWLHIGWRNQAHRVTKFSDLTCPVMRTAACFHGDSAGRLFGEELQHLVAPQLLAENNSAGSIRSVGLKDILCQIQTNHINFHLGRLLFSWRLQSPPLWHIDAAERASTPSHTVAVRDGCTMIPLACGKGSGGRDHS